MLRSGELRFAFGRMGAIAPAAALEALPVHASLVTDEAAAEATSELVSMSEVVSVPLSVSARAGGAPMAGGASNEDDAPTADGFFGEAAARRADDFLGDGFCL